MTSAYRPQRRSFGRRTSFLAKVALPILAALLVSNCGDVYRPIALPIPGQPPTPAPVGHMVVISTNGASPSNPLLGPGSVGRIDVSGDSMVSTNTAGLAPAKAVLSSIGRLYVPNSDEDTVFASPITSAPQGTTIDLVPVCSGTSCPAVNPVFAETTESGRVYVAGMGNGTISAIDSNANVVVQTWAVDPAQAGSPLPLPDTSSQPVALVELPNGTKIYSINRGTNSVSSINTLDGHINKVIPVGPLPVWGVANADNLHVYVLDSAGAIWVIDATTDTASQVIYGSPGPLPNHLVYDKALNRVYATDANSAQPKLAIFDVTGTSGNPNSTLTPNGSLGFPVISVAPGSPCSSNPIPTSVTVLGDGSRAYVASYQTGNNLICTQVTVINPASGVATKTIPLFVAADNAVQTNCDLARFRSFAASSLGAANSLFKVYVSQCDAGTVAIIDTAAVSIGPSQHSADSIVGWLAPPISSFQSSQISINGAAQTAATTTTPATTTFTYSILSGPAVQVGVTVYVSGMADSGNNGAFLVTAANSQSSTFTVSNAGGVNASSQDGTGSVMPPQNPVFLVPAP
jgi:DNA-binding beta-propeller fold protein YncE